MSRTRPRNPWQPTFIAAAALVLLATAVWRGLSDPPPAFGQIPDSGAQRDAMLKEMRVQTERLGEIAGLLREIRDRHPAPPKSDKPAGG